MNHPNIISIEYTNTFNKTRTDAFKLFEDECKTQRSKKLRFTKMCQYVEAGKKCPRKKGTCLFAHSHDQLKKHECFFGDACKYKDSKCRPCPFYHPTQTVSPSIKCKDIINDHSISIKSISI